LTERPIIRQTGACSTYPRGRRRRTMWAEHGTLKTRFRLPEPSRSRGIGRSRRLLSRLDQLSSYVPHACIRCRRTTLPRPCRTSGLDISNQSSTSPITASPKASPKRHNDDSIDSNDLTKDAGRHELARQHNVGARTVTGNAYTQRCRRDLYGWSFVGGMR
jgi:hypothetical protein